MCIENLKSDEDLVQHQQSQVVSAVVLSYLALNDKRCGQEKAKSEGKMQVQQPQDHPSHVGM